MDFLNKRLIEAVGQLRSEVELLRKSIDATRDQEERHHHQEQNQTAPTVRAELLIPEDVKKERQSNEDRNYGLQRWLAIGTWCAFVAAAIYAGLAACQLRTFNGQLSTMNSTFNQIQQQTTLMRQQVVGSQAAVLEISLEYNDGNGQFSLGLGNSGHVTATDIHVSIDASEQRIQDGGLIGKPFHFEPNIQPLPAGHGFNKYWPLPWRLTEKERNQGGTWPPDWPGKRTFVFRTDVTYQDGFGDEIQQQICRQWLPGFSIIYKEQRSGGGGLYDCDNIKEVIRSIFEQERKAEQGALRPE